MKFDEAFKCAKENSFIESYEDIYVYNHVIDLDDVIEILEKLEDEYAPTIEMTKRQYEILVLSRNNAVNRVDKVGILEFMSAYALLNQEIDHLSLMQAWLHPETVKLVDYEI